MAQKANQRGGCQWLKRVGWGGECNNKSENSTASAKNGAQIKKNKNRMEMTLYKNVKMRQAITRHKKNTNYF